jgi:hypothetical protein
MRRVFFAGVAASAVVAVMSFAIGLLNQPSDLAVAEGYFVLLALVSAASGVAANIWRRL